MDISTLMYVTLSLGEELEVDYEMGKLDTYANRLALHTNGMCGIVDEQDLETRPEQIIDNNPYFTDWDKFNTGRDAMLTIKNQFGGVLLAWCFEYDNQWTLIFDPHKHNISELVRAWLNRDTTKEELHEYQYNH